MSKKYFLPALAAAVLLSFSVVRSDDAEEKEKFKPLCPVSGKAIDTEHAVEYKKGEVYFCCPNCPKAFKANTEKFAAKANHQLVGTKQYKQAKCPIAGRDINPDTQIEVAKVKVAFCCNGCKGKATKVEGNEQIELIFNDKAFKKGFEVAKKEKDE